jgi:hypothetical protein
VSVRGYVSYVFDDFGDGLNLRAKPDALAKAECQDCLNVRFTDRGAVEQRPGYGSLTEAALTNRVSSLEAFYQTSGTKQLLAGCGTRLEGLSAAGAVVDSETGLTNAIWDFARFGKPNAERAYAGNGTDSLRKWDGKEWTAPTATVDGEAGKTMPKAGSLCVWPEAGNRMVVAGFSTTTGGPGGAISSPDHVWFSDPGNPESWHTKEPEENSVQLFPGNGEPIMAVVAWREYVIAFKQTSYFVFTNQGISGEGSPEFTFRPVEAGVGMVSPRAVCVHPSGVYFMSRHGVYRTTGQEPEEVSQIIEPIWSGAASAFFTGGVLAHASITECAMGTYEDRIYLAYPTASGNDRVLVYDPQLGWWSLFDLPASCLTTFRAGNSEELVFGYASGENKIGRHSPAYANDDGATIESHWRSGWFDLDNPDVKTLRSSKLWGTGRVFAGLAPDYRQETGDLELLDFEDEEADQWGKTTWGGGKWAAPRGLLPAHRRNDVRGGVFSLFLSNGVKDQGFSVHRCVHHLREIARPERTST